MKSRLFFLFFVLFAPFSTSWAMDKSAPQPETPAAPEAVTRMPVKKLTEEELIARAKVLRALAKKNRHSWSSREQIAEILGLPITTGIGTWAFFSESNSQNAAPRDDRSGETRMDAITTVLQTFVPHGGVLRETPTESPSESTVQKPNYNTKHILVKACGLLFTCLMARTLYKWYTTNYADNIIAMTLPPAELIQILKNPNARKELSKDLIEICDSIKERRFNQRIDQLKANGMDYETARQTAWNEELELANG